MCFKFVLIDKPQNSSVMTLFLYICLKEKPFERLQVSCIIIDKPSVMLIRFLYIEKCMVRISICSIVLQAFQVKLLFASKLMTPVLMCIEGCRFDTVSCGRSLCLVG